MNGLSDDPFIEGMSRNKWQVNAAYTDQVGGEITADVVIIGTGAGGGITAELCARAGLQVLMLEEGPLKTSNDFKMLESQAYPTLYQEAAARKTADKGINILQGRTVGGSTTVNWTSSFRTPEDTMGFWAEHFDLGDINPETMLPWFEQVEQRLNMAPWHVEPNANNSILKEGAEKLGLHWSVISRNVRACWNLGYCGVGCPINAKLSMLVTCIPTALEYKARLITHCRAHSFELAHNQVKALKCQAMNADGILPSGKTFKIKAKHFVLAGGAINSPAVLLRSNAPDPSRQLGARTCLHPVVLSAAQMSYEVKGYAGAPQSIYSDHYLHTNAIDGPLGFKIEVPPLHPVIFATTLPGMSERHLEIMRQFPNMHMQLALLRDGFHPDSQGGTVRLNEDGYPILDYKLTPAIWEAARRALRAMTEIQFAAGAKKTLPIHEDALFVNDLENALKQINTLPMKPLKMKVVSAHVMGGCLMAGQESLGVVQPNGRHWQIENLSIHDGSLFPTSLGVNPQLSIYGLSSRLASDLIETLTGKPAPTLI